MLMLIFLINANWREIEVTEDEIGNALEWRRGKWLPTWQVTKWENFISDRWASYAAGPPSDGNVPPGISGTIYFNFGQFRKLTHKSMWTFLLWQGKEQLSHKMVEGTHSNSGQSTQRTNWDSWVRTTPHLPHPDPGLRVPPWDPPPSRGFWSIKVARTKGLPCPQACQQPLTHLGDTRVEGDLWGIITIKSIFSSQGVRTLLLTEYAKWNPLPLSSPLDLPSTQLVKKNCARVWSWNAHSCHSPKILARIYELLSRRDKHTTNFETQFVPDYPPTPTSRPHLWARPIPRPPRRRRPPSTQREDNRGCALFATILPSSTRTAAADRGSRGERRLHCCPRLFRSRCLRCCRRTRCTGSGWWGDHRSGDVIFLFNQNFKIK